MGYVGTATWGIGAFVTLFVMVICLVAFVDALLRPPKAYPAADKQRKLFWTLILGVAALLPWLFGAMSFFTILGVVAAIVYLVDARPALKASGGSFGKVEKVSMPLIALAVIGLVLLLWLV